MPSVRVFVKKQRQVAHLGFKQFQMLKIGTVATAAVKNRVTSGLNAADAPSKPLSKGYAIFKTRRLRRKVKRDLTLTGQMLNNLQVRTVSNNYAQSRNTTRKDREKANRNQQVEPWVVYSRENERAITRATLLIFAENVRHLVR